MFYAPESLNFSRFFMLNLCAKSRRRCMISFSSGKETHRSHSVSHIGKNGAWDDNGRTLLLFNQEGMNLVHKNSE